MIRPAYWTDSDLHTRLTAEQREFYIGLWMLADDEGYVAWDPDRVGAELYPYRSAAWRSKRLSAWLALLGSQHARLLDCGLHVVIPNLPRYQQPPRPTSLVRRAHDRCIQVASREVSAPHVTPAREVKGKEGKGREGNGGAPSRAVADATTGDSEFQRLVPKAAALGRPA